jgi:thymidylate synthase ThyX
MSEAQARENIRVKVIASTGNPRNHEQRITTLQLRYPRFIHAEFMTHRAFSRNASSSRAIPVEKLTKAATSDPALFVHIGSNKPGMQAGEQVDDATREKFEQEWRELAEINAEYALRWANKYNIHKQVVNRVMEPWHHIDVVVTATNWRNFFDLRAHPAAQPEIQELAVKMREAIESKEGGHIPSMPPGTLYPDSPYLRDPRNVHLPYVRDEEKQSLPLDVCVKLSVARCARVSYSNHDGSTPDILKDIDLHDRLIEAEPAHASPAEHQAVPDLLDPSRCWANFKGFQSYRNALENGGRLRSYACLC